MRSNNRSVCANCPLASVSANILLVIVLAFALSGCIKPDTTPPANVLNLTATPGSQQMALTWENPTDADFAGVRIQRRADGYPSSAGDGDTVYTGIEAAYTDTGLTNGLTYYYTVFSYDAVPNYASGSQATGIPTAPGAAAEVLDSFDELYGMLNGAMSPNLAPGALTDLTQSLLGAEKTYREGDPCLAAAGMGGFLGKAQTYRAGTAQPDSERLYNLGRMLRALMANDIADKADCPEVARIGVDAAAALDEEQSDVTKLGTLVDFGEPKVLTKEQAGETFTKLEVPGADAEMGSPGMPAIPSFRRLFAAPPGAAVEVTVESEEAESIAMKLYPSQPQAVDAADPAVFMDPPFVKDETVYQTDALFPPDRVLVAEVGQYRDMRVFSMEVPAGQYNPVSETLTLFRNVRVNVSFSGGAGGFITEASQHPGENGSLLAGMVLNGSLIFDHLTPPLFTPMNMGQELMILTHPDFEEAAQRLADWKNEKGIVTQVFIVNDGVSEPGPDTGAAIDDLIESEFDNSSIRPSYVLLFGDADYIPPFYLAANNPDRVGSTNIGTDWSYADYERTTFDLLPDFGVGRITVDTADEAEDVVDKIINYESAPPNNAGFYSNAMIAAQFQCCNQYTTQLGVDQRTFIWVSEWCRNVMAANGKTVQRIYARTIDGGCSWCNPQVPAYTSDATPRRYHDGTSLPSDIGAGSGFSWNGSNTDIINAFNAGRFLVIHRDHGSPGAWETPWFRWSNVYGNDGTPDTDIANGALLPAVFSVNCASGLFDSETSGGALGATGNFDYLVERLIKKPDGGAIVVFGDTRNSPSMPNSVLLQGFFDALWPGAIATFGQNTALRRAGDVLNHGKMYLLSQLNLIDDVSSGTVGDETLMWHVYGDPTLEIWTANPYAVTLPTQATGTWNGDVLRINYGMNNVTVTATQTNIAGGVVAFGRGLVQNGAVNLLMLGAPNAGKDTQVAFNFPNAIARSTTIPDAVAPANVTGFTAVAHKQTIMMNWTNPTSDFQSVRIQRKTGSYPTSPADGTTVYNGSGTSYYDGQLATGTKFYYTAYAHDDTPNYASGAQANATTWADVTAPGSVTGFSAAAGPGQIVLTWTNPAASDFTGTRIVRKQGGCTFSETDGVVVYDGTGTSFTDTGLANGQQYYYGAYAHDGWPNYAFGVCANATTPSDVTAPANVTGFTAAPGDKQIVLTWTNPADSDLTGVKILRKTGGYPSGVSDGTAVYDGLAGTFTDTGLTNGTAYFYRAYAHDALPNYASGANATATPSDTTPPPNVFNFQAAPTSCSAIGLTWQNPVGTDFAGVKILRKMSGYPSSTTDGLVVYTGSGTSASDASGIIEQGTYYYKAFAYDGSQNYASGVQDTTVAQNCAPPPPSGFSALPGDQQVILGWTNPSVADFVKVVVVRKMYSYPTSVSGGTVVYEGAGAAHIDTGLVNTRQYFYTAFAYDGKLYSTGAQATATPVSSADTTPPGNITAFAAEPYVCPTLSLTWENPGDNDFAGVIVVRKTDSYPVAPTDGLAVYSGTGTSFVDGQDIAEKTAYYYTAFSYDAAQNYSSGAQATAVTNDCTPPSNVTEFAADPGMSDITLTWINPGDADFAGVRIQRRSDVYPSAYNDGDTVYQGGDQLAVDQPPQTGVTYYYTAFAFDDAGLYATGAQAQAALIVPDVTPPGEVAQFGAAPDGCGTVSLSWQNPGDPDFAGVVVVRKLDGFPQSPTDGTPVYDGTGAAYADSQGLADETQYFYAAFTYDAVPNYSAGAQAEVFTIDCTPPGNVTGFMAAPGQAQATLTWQNPADADFTGVRIVRKNEDYPAAIDDGQVVYEGSGQEYTDEPLEDNVTFYYKAFAFDDAGNYASGAQASVMPHEMTPPPDVGRFMATAGNQSVNLVWLAPTDSDYVGVTIRRSAKTYPVNPEDGDLVCEGVASPFLDSGLDNGTPYYYTAFSYDAWMNYSAGVQATATPMSPFGGR